jgi:hypothetical protein
MRVIDQIMEDYGMYNGFQLEELVYREDPWKNTPEMGIISNGEIEKYYKGLLEKDRPEVAMSEAPSFTIPSMLCLSLFWEMSMSFPYTGV